MSFPWIRAALRALAALTASVLLVACDGGTPSFQGSDISGTHLGQGLSLTNQDGKPVVLKDYADKVVVVFFGFTQCPDVCPTSLAELARVMQTLGEDADEVQVVLITVDPERDTPAVLRQYVKAFDPRFEGLTGTPEQIKQAAGSFKAYYAKVPSADGNYSMDHSAAFYLLDKQGEARVLVNNTAGAEALAHDIRQLL